jgi:hypothetical protein
MGCRTDFCIGGGCVPTSTSVEAWLSAFGYTYEENDPLATDYANLIAQSPSAFNSGGLYSAWPALAEACMRSRAMLFCNSSPGDSGSTQATSSTSDLLEQAGEQAASLVPVAGQVLSDVLEVFQAHAAAEKAQATALATLAPQITEAFRRADASVAAGTSTQEQAIAFLQQTSLSAQQSWSALTKSCNAFCWFNQILNLMVSVSEYYYQLGISAASLEQSNEENIIPTTSNIPANGVLAGLESSLSSATSGLAISSKSLIIGLLVLSAIGLVVVFGDEL